MSKADNMLSILWFLKSRKRMTAKQLSEELEITIRTVYRYIDALCASGVPIVADSGHNGGYSLLHDFTDVPLVFDMDEQKALIHAAVFAKEAGYPFGEALNRAVEKLKRYTNEEQRQNIALHEMGFDVISPPPDTSLENTLQEIEESVAKSETLHMAYQKGIDPTTSKREIDPYGLVHWKGKWYVVAFCHLRKEIRSFRVDRIQSLTRRDAFFLRPDAFSARDFFMNSLLPSADKQDQLLSIRIGGKESALKDLSQHWLVGHALQDRSNEELHFKLDEKAIRTYLPYILLPYGRAIEVKEPSLLKVRMVEVTKTLLDFYQTF